MKKETKNYSLGKKKKATNIICTISTCLIMAALSANSFQAAAPSGVDNAAYNGLIDIVFWVATIAIAAAGGIPSLIKLVQGQADDDPRGRNAGIAGLVITGAVIGAATAVKTLLF